MLQATNIARIENDISNNTLEGSNLRARIERLTETIQEYEEEIKLKNEIVTRCINETVKRNATIERKQGVIDQLNKKIDLMLSQSGVSKFFHKRNIPLSYGIFQWVSIEHSVL